MFKNARLIKVLGGVGVAAGLAAFLAIPAGAADANGNLTVSASVSGKCQVNASTISFGAYDPLVTNKTADLDGEGAVKIACTKGQGGTLTLDMGLNGGGTARKMKHDTLTDTLNYELYSDSGRSKVWSSGSGKTVTAAAASSRAEQSFPVYGRITGGQDVSTGSYSDTVVININY